MLPVLPDSGTYSTASLNLTGSHGRIGWTAADLGLPWRAAAHGADRARDDDLFTRLGPDGIRSLAAYSLGSTHVVLKQYPTSKYPTASCSRNGYLRSESVTAALHRQ